MNLACKILLSPVPEITIFLSVLGFIPNKAWPGSVIKVTIEKSLFISEICPNTPLLSITVCPKKRLSFFPLLITILLEKGLKFILISSAIKIFEDLSEP